ncbi:MAG: FAD-binding oxidoreductase [Acidimicrobiales bacterium]
MPIGSGRDPDPDPLAAELLAIVGRAHVLTEPEVMAPYTVDWTGRWRGRARLVVRPASTEEVAAVVAVCAEARAPIVAQGGNTGLVGGGVPRDGEVVLSLRRLDGLDPVDVDTAQLVGGAGVTLARAQAHARAVGLDVAIDLAARDSATLGGIVATNAGGERVIRHGPARAQVLGLEAVLANGRVVRRMSGLAKDSAGFDITSLLVGSEGTLGAVTRVRLRLVPHLTDRVVALLAVDGTQAAVRLLRTLRRRRPDLEAAELFDADGLDLVCDLFGRPRPFAATHPSYLLVECAGPDDPTEALASALEDVDGLLDAAIAGDGPRRAALWGYREALSEAINLAGVPLKLDVAVPLPVVAEFEHELRPNVADVAPEGRLVVFGHLAEGNLHVNLLGAEDRWEDVTAAVLGLVARFGGSIGAEHGVGQAKVRWLPLTRSREELAAMVAVKRALDPDWLLNPGVVLPVPDSRPGS